MRRNSNLRLTAPLTIFLLLGSSPLDAQQFRATLPVERLVYKLSYSEDSSSLSSDGQWFAYTVRDPQKIGAVAETSHPWGAEIVRTDGYDIWITNTQSLHSENVTGGVGANWGPVWSPDGNYLAFYSTRSGNANLWVYDTRSAKLRRVSDAVSRPFGSQVVRWTSDSKKVMTKIASEDLVAKEDRSFPVIPEGNFRVQPKQGGPTVVLYRTSVRSESTLQASQDDSGVVQDSRSKAERADLALIDVKNGRVDRIAHGFNPEWYGISPDGSLFAFASWKGTLHGDVNKNVFDLFVVSDKQQPKLIASNITRRALEFAASWSPDGKWLSYVAIGDGSEGECYLVPISGESPRKATAEKHPAFNEWAGTAPYWDPSSRNVYMLASFDAVWKISVSDGKTSEVTRIPHGRIYSIVAPLNQSQFWTPDGGRSLVVSFMDVLTKESGFYGIDLDTGEARDLLRRDKFNENFSHRISYSINNRNLVYFSQDAGHEPNFWIVDSDFKGSHQLTHINPWLESYEMGKTKLIEWRTLDGETIRGALLLPSGYQEGKKYPLIVNVYGGGGLSSTLNSFGLSSVPDYAPRNMQLLATRGYAVLCPDSPMGVATPMKDLLKTVLPGVNKAIDIGIADPERLGLMGVSFGGYHVLSLLVQTTRFKAAIMIAGFGDLVGMSGEMDDKGVSLGGIILDPMSPWGRMPGEPWAYPGVYIENSPVFYLDRVETPILILHGASDRNVAPFLADQIFVFLRRLGREAVYAKYEDEGHTILLPANLVDVCNREIAWFDDHLLGKESTQGR